MNRECRMKNEEWRMTGCVESFRPARMSGAKRIHHSSFIIRHSLRRGVALIIVLGFVALLGILVAGMMSTLGTRLVDGEKLAQRGSLRNDAESAVEVARARLSRYAIDAQGIRLTGADLQQIALDPLDGWIPKDGATVAVKIRDESGLYSINITDTIALQNLFQDTGLDETKARSLADCLADWIDTDDNPRELGAESGDYGVPGMPANRPVKSFAELRRVKGFDLFFNDDGSPNDLGKELAASVTFLDAGPYPDINGAPENVLNALASRATLDVSAVLANRSVLNYPDDRTHPGVIRDAGGLGALGASGDVAQRVSFGARTIRVVVTVTKGELKYVVDVLLGPSTTGRGAPVVVLKRADDALLAEEGAGYAEGSSADTAGN